MRNLNGSNIFEKTGELAFAVRVFDFGFLGVHPSRAIVHYLHSERWNQSPSNVYGGAETEEDFAEQGWIHDGLILGRSEIRENTISLDVQLISRAQPLLAWGPRAFGA